MYFSMIEPGYPMDKEMMLEPGSTVLKDMSFCNVAFFAPVEAADADPAVSSVSAAEFDRTRKTKKSNQKKIFHFRISNIYTAEQCLCSSLHGVKEGHIAEAHVLQHG